MRHVRSPDAWGALPSEAVANTVATTTYATRLWIFVIGTIVSQLTASGVKTNWVAVACVVSIRPDCFSVPFGVGQPKITRPN